jgi:hypothetical protein
MGLWIMAKMILLIYLKSSPNRKIWLQVTQESTWRALLTQFCFGIRKMHRNTWSLKTNTLMPEWPDPQPLITHLKRFLQQNHYSKESAIILKLSF